MDDELREVLRRADRHPDRQSQLRRTAFERILELAHSDNSAHKRLATQKIKDYFIDFPDLKDQAINTIYDLCEDPDQNIRICGYGAITSISRVDRSWLVRNADVLVQLLQSDDEREVTVVKKALQEHIDIDPSGTLRVLCDQCAVDGDASVNDAAMDVDDEDAMLRRRLRSLVLRFLVEKYNVCIARVVRDGEAEEVLFNGLLKAIPQLTLDETRLIINEILIKLPSLSTRADRNNSLLDALLQRATLSFQAETGEATASTPSSLQRTLPILDLACVLVIAHSRPPVVTLNQRTGVVRAHPERMLRIFFASSGVHLSLSTSQERLTPSAEERIALIVARTWEACNEVLQTTKDEGRKRQIIQLRHEVAKKAGYLLNVLSRTKSLDTFQALSSILKAVQSQTPAHSTPASQALLVSLVEPIKASIASVSVVPPTLVSTSGDRTGDGQEQAHESLFDPKADVNAVRMEVGHLCRALLQAAAASPALKVSSSTSTSDGKVGQISTHGISNTASNGTSTRKGIVTINRNIATAGISTSTSTSFGKRKLDDTDVDVSLAQRLGEPSSSPSKVPAQVGGVGFDANVSIFGAASRSRVNITENIRDYSTQNPVPTRALAGTNVRPTQDQLRARFERFGVGSPSPSPAPDASAMDTELGHSPRSAKRARSTHDSGSGPTDHPSPAGLLSRMTTNLATPPPRTSPRNSSPISRPQNKSTGTTSTPSLLSRMRTTNSSATDVSTAGVRGLEIRLRGAASAGFQTRQSHARLTGSNSPGNTNISTPSAPTPGHAKTDEAGADVIGAGDGLSIRGAASRLGGTNLADRLGGGNVEARG